jgi:hypothetical protein
MNPVRQLTQLRDRPCEIGVGLVKQHLRAIGIVAP